MRKTINHRCKCQETQMMELIDKSVKKITFVFSDSHLEPGEEVALTILDKLIKGIISMLWKVGQRHISSEIIFIPLYENSLFGSLSSPPVCLAHRCVSMSVRKGTACLEVGR